MRACRTCAKRLGVAGKPGDLVYDKALFNAIKNVQARADIKPTGVIDGKTLAAINGPKPGQQIERVVANMERWRWLPRDLGKHLCDGQYPGLHAQGGARQRPGLAHQDRRRQAADADAAGDARRWITIIVNPSWYVPQSIIQNELLPRYASDPNIFDRMGLEVKRGPDGNINVVQPPGAANALGRIKFNFPNKFQVYLHDTPEKRLFAARQARLQPRLHARGRPDQVRRGHAASGDGRPDAEFAADQRHVRSGRAHLQADQPADGAPHLPDRLVDDGGKLVLRDDIYGFDGRIQAILHSDERRIADVAPPQDPKRDLATAKATRKSCAGSSGARRKIPSRSSNGCSASADSRHQMRDWPGLSPANCAFRTARVPARKPPRRPRPGHFPPCSAGS